MATYAVGDVQGCFRTFEFLLERLAFDPARDRLWMAGDLVNRGPLSVEVLRWARRHDDCVTAILGNHDLHLLARARIGTRAKNKDTIDDVLSAPDRDDLIEWLLHRPIVHREGNYLMLHAGLLPVWNADDAEALGREIERFLRRDDELLSRLAERRPATWTDALGGIDRAEHAARILLNLRVCDPHGRPVFDFTGPPDEAPADRIAWHVFPGRRPVGATVVCGHWAAQGLLVRGDLLAIDTGAVWRGALTAIDLETRETLSVPLVDSL